MVGAKRAKDIAEFLRFGGIKARFNSSDNSISVRGEKGFKLAKKDRAVKLNKLKIKRA